MYGQRAGGQAGQSSLEDMMLDLALEPQHPGLNQEAWIGQGMDCVMSSEPL